MRHAALLATALLSLAACAPDSARGPLAPASDPSAAKGSVLGSPKFADQFTSCGFSTGGSTVSCDYKITGGGNTQSADVILEAHALFDGQCQNHGGQIVEVKDFSVDVSTTQAGVQFENGQITSTISTSLPTSAPSPRTVCPNGNWTVQNWSYAFTGDFELRADIHSGGSTLTIYSEYRL